MAVGKTKRASKTSKGINGGGGKLTTPLTEVQKVLMGKGRLLRGQNFTGTPWVGVTQPSQPVFNRAQVEENKRLYPHIFGGK